MYTPQPETLSVLLQWPAALSRFEFDGEVYPHGKPFLDYPMFEPLLLIHKGTLRHVSLGRLSVEASAQVFNATLFPHLEYLKLSRWHTHEEPTSFQANDVNILGPSLKIFCWDFSAFSHRSGEDWLAVGQEEVLWIEIIAREAIARKSALQTFQILFNPAVHDSTEDMGYPWDNMMELRERLFSPNAMDLVYDEPFNSKDDWLDYLKKRNEYQESWIEDLDASSSSDEEVNKIPLENESSENEEEDSDDDPFESWYQ
jgi:hypothetical protein